MFTYCFLVTNLAAGAIYVPYNFYKFTLILTSSFMILPLLIGLIIIVIFNRKGKTDDDDNSDAFTCWYIPLSIWALVSFILFFIYLPYNGNWQTDTTNPMQSAVRNMFFVVQGSLAIGYILVWLIIFLICCCKSTKEVVQDSIADAKTKTHGYQNAQDCPLNDK